MIEKQKFERIKMCYTKFHEWHEKVQVLQTSQYKCASELIKTYPVLEYWADSGSDKKKKNARLKTQFAWQDWIFIKTWRLCLKFYQKICHTCLMCMEPKFVWHFKGFKQDMFVIWRLVHHFLYKLSWHTYTFLFCLKTKI